jgi:hypothetical protein
MKTGFIFFAFGLAGLLLAAYQPISKQKAYLLSAEKGNPEDLIAERTFLGRLELTCTYGDGLQSLLTLSMANALAHKGLKGILRTIPALEINLHAVLVAAFSVLFREYFSSMPVDHIAGNIADYVEHFGITCGVFEALRNLERGERHGIDLETFLCLSES